MKKIVLVTEALTTGGAETFVLRLAAALETRCCKTTVVVLRGDLVNVPLVQSLASELHVVSIQVFCLRWVILFDGLLYKIGLSFSVHRWLQVLQLRKELRKISPDVVHAHLLTSDLVTARACRPLGIPWISTMHGDYLALEALGSSCAARIPDFHAALREIEPLVGHIVCITSQQHSQLARLLPSLDKASRLSKFYNGYAATKDDLAQQVPPEALRKISEGDFVVGMVARGVRDKGWEVLITAFSALDLPNAWLVLVGDGDYLQQIRSSNQNPRIVFCGNVVDPLRYIARFDVGCLPSQFTTESLPTVVIEYLYLGKPVIATAVGEIPRMLNADSDAPAGLLINLANTPAMAEQMKVALMRLYKDKNERARMSYNAKTAVQKFDMDACVDAYLDVYKSAQR